MNISTTVLYTTNKLSSSTTGTMHILKQVSSPLVVQIIETLESLQLPEQEIFAYISKIGANTNSAFNFHLLLQKYQCLFADLENITQLLKDFDLKESTFNAFVPLFIKSFNIVVNLNEILEQKLDINQVFNFSNLTSFLKLENSNIFEAFEKAHKSLFNEELLLDWEMQFELFDDYELVVNNLDSGTYLCKFEIGRELLFYSDDFEYFRFKGHDFDSQLLENCESVDFDVMESNIEDEIYCKTKTGTIRTEVETDKEDFERLTISLDKSCVYEPASLNSLIEKRLSQLK